MLIYNIDLIIQPFISDISIDKGILTDVVGMLEYLRDEKQESRFWQVFHDVFNKMCELTAHTMDYAVVPAKNDRFFYERLKTKEQDGISGRLEQFYEGVKFNLQDIHIGWEELKKVQWIIDGIEYGETLNELITDAKQTLNPDNKRIIGLCHGDGHEMNIYTNALSKTPQEHKFAYLDMETAGQNSVLGEVVIFLVYNSVMGDYTVPKYYPEHCSEKNRAMNASIDHMHRKNRPGLSVEHSEDKITIESVENFGTSPVRKAIAKLYISVYVDTILDIARNKWGGAQFQ